MMKIPTCLGAAAAALTLTLAGCASPPMALDAPAATGVAPTTSVAEADAKLADAALRRAAAEARFAASERECNVKFFVNRCLDQAREQRRATLAALRAIEVEAGQFKRVEAVERRDAALAERQRQDEREAAARAALPPKPAYAAPAEQRVAPTKADAFEKRQAARAAGERSRKAREAAGADERAARVAAFKLKQKEAAERQRAVAEKQAAKAAQAAKDAAAAAAPAAGK